MHCRKDYVQLVAILHELSVPCRVAAELTTDYHRTLAFFLLRHGIEAAFVLSLAGARFRGATSTSLDKNNPKDTEAIPRLPKLGITRILVAERVCAHATR